MLREEYANDLVEFVEYVASIFFLRFFKEYFLESNLSVVSVDKSNKVCFSISNRFYDSDFTFDVQRIEVGDGLVCDIRCSSSRSGGRGFSGLYATDERSKIEDFSDRVIRGLEIEYTVKRRSSRGSKRSRKARGKRAS